VARTPNTAISVTSRKEEQETDSRK